MKKYFEIEMTADNFGLYAIEGVREVLTDRIAIYKFRNDVSVFGYDDETIFIKMPHNPGTLRIVYSILLEEFPNNRFDAFRRWADEEGIYKSDYIDEKRLIK